jgi:F0F1-type ATP synthase assembly protein I
MDKPPPPPNIWKHVYAGTTLALTVLIGIYAGIRVDRHFNSSPWGTLGGVAVGVGVGMYNFFREFLS